MLKYLPSTNFMTDNILLLLFLAFYGMIHAKITTIYDKIFLESILVVFVLWLITYSGSREILNAIQKK